MFLSVCFVQWCVARANNRARLGLYINKVTRSHHCLVSLSWAAGLRVCCTHTEQRKQWRGWGAPFSWIYTKSGIMQLPAGLCRHVGVFICAEDQKHCESIRKWRFISLIHCCVLCDVTPFLQLFFSSIDQRCSLSPVEPGKRGQVWMLCFASRNNNCWSLQHASKRCCHF